MPQVTSIRGARDRRGLTQDQLAEAAGVHRTTINRIERGHRLPSPPVATRIGRALDGVVLAAVLLNTDDDAHPEAHLGAGANDQDRRAAG